jgi:competence protein ComEA
VAERPEIAALGAVVAALAIVALGQQGLREPEPEAAVGADHGARARGAPRTPAPVAALVALRDGEPLDLNCADAATLELLPGVGPALAQRILEHRFTAGRFESVDGLRAVRGVGPKKLAAVRPLLSIGASTCPTSTTPRR